MFKTNVGTPDRILRVIVGIALIAWWYTMSIPVWGIVALIVGIVLLVTGLVSSCPIYSVLGMSTCPMKK